MSDRARKFVVTLLAAPVALAFGLAAAAPAAAAPAIAAQSADAGINDCSYVVRYDGLAVRENPSPDSIARKFKPYGSVVVGPCVNSQHSSGEWYSAVYCECATDGIGWMRTAYLDRIS